jgi:ABC-type phosphate transport system ATPase subunit
MTIGGIDMMTLPEYVTGRQIGYVDQDAYIRSGSIRDNLFYGLKHHPQSEASTSEDALKKRLESELSGNSPHDINAEWLDQDIFSGSSQDGLLQNALQALRAVGLEDDILSIGIRSTIDPEIHPKLAGNILQARNLIQERMKSSEFEGLVESWNRDSYNANASVAENILFGTPVDDSFDIEALGKNELVLAVLNKIGLYDDFLEMGRKIASLMVELFHDLPPGHEYFERFSFISADDLPDFQIILNASASDGLVALSEEQRVQLLQLPFRLISAKHRLGLIDDDMESRLLAARRAFEEDLPPDMLGKISFFESDTYNPSSSVLDNALFGKINAGRSDATKKIQQLVASIIDELDLRLPILESGLGFEVGISGRRLSVTQRQKLAIARNLVKNPRLLIVNEATGVLDSVSQSSVFDAIKNAMKDRGLVWVDSEIADPEQFDRMFLAEAGKVKEKPVQQGE